MFCTIASLDIIVKVWRKGGRGHDLYHPSSSTQMDALQTCSTQNSNGRGSIPIPNCAVPLNPSGQTSCGLRRIFDVGINGFELLWSKQTHWKGMLLRYLGIDGRINVQIVPFD